MKDAAPLPLIEASRCSSCGEFTIPPREHCPYCRAYMERTAVEAWGNVLSWTTVYVTPEGFSSPRTVAMVQLDCGARILCSIPGGSEPVMETRVGVILDNGSFLVK